MTIPGDLPGQIADIYRRLAELERRDRNRKRTGVITEVDTAKGLARVELSRPGGGAPYLSAWLPWKEAAAGGIKSHIPPSIGEQVDLASESGDLTDAVIDLSSPSQANPRPHDGPEMVVTKGISRIQIGDDEIDVTTGKIVTQAETITETALATIDVTTPMLTITADIRIVGNVEIIGQTDITGTELRHNGLNIGSTHVHRGVRSGSDLSDVPN
jgi:phage baseplate assembly protein V